MSTEPANDEVPIVHNYAFDKDFLGVLMGEPFLGAISMGVVKVEDKDCKTAYVGFDPKLMEVVLGFNPDFMLSLIGDHRRGVILHELYHITLHHIMERSVADKRKHKLWNIATDLAINSIIGAKNLPDCALVPGTAPKNCEDPKAASLIASFPLMESADWYMEKLEQFVEENPGGGMGDDGEGEITIGIGDADGQTMDSHHGWGDLPDEIKDIVREKIREAIEKGVRAVQQTGRWGSVPASMQDMLQKYLHHEIDWRSVLRLFLGRTRSDGRISTVRRINKKAPEIFPGVKRTTITRFLIAIDQSGSMSDGDVQIGLAEAFACAKLAEIDIVNFDTELDESSFKTIKRSSQFKWERTRCGGTNFDCVRRFVNDPKNRGRWAGVVIFTDGYADKLGQVHGAKVLWLLTEGGTMSAVRPGDLVIQIKHQKTVAIKR